MYRSGSQMHFCFYAFTKLEELSRNSSSGSEQKENKECACVFFSSFDREALWLWVQPISRTVISDCGFGCIEITFTLERF